MDKKQRIEQEVNKTLEQFDNAEKLPPDPYFYTRLQAHLKEQQSEKISFRAVIRPALMAILLILNITTAVLYLARETPTSSSDSRQELVSLFSEDLHVQSYNVDIMNLK